MKEAEIPVKPVPVKPVRYVQPRPRPRIVAGKTIKTETGCGTLYVTINEDEHGIAEVFVRLGKSGGCSAAQTEAIGRLISLALRSFVDPGEIVRQLKGIRCSTTRICEGEVVTSCADAVAKVLEKYIKGEFSQKFRVEGIIPLSEFLKEYEEKGGEEKEKENEEREKEDREDKDREGEDEDRENSEPDGKHER